MKHYFNKSIKEVSQELGVDILSGLESQEAKKRLSEYGQNTLKAKKGKSFFIMFIEQFKSFMIFILIIAAIISGVVGIRSGEGLLDTYIIMGILLMNALIGAYQEKKAQKSLESLKKLSSPTAKVIRDGQTSTIPATDIVPGDIIEIETGDIIPADVRLVEAVNLKVQESSMTGESVPVEKHSDIISDTEASLGDRFNMAFSSGIVTYGRGKGIVIGTGMNTEIGNIAQMLEDNTGSETPMKVRLEKLGKILGIASLIICAIIFIIGVIYGRPVLSMFMVAISLAVAAIPEGLPAISTIVLSIGVQRMVKHNAIIRTLPSVETLGSTTIICSDKTGTLTQNKMTVVENFSLNSSNDNFISISVLCNDTKVSKDGENKVIYTGDPTETALIDFGDKNNIYKKELEKLYPRIDEVPFDSTRKRMSTINKIGENRYKVNVKGGLDEVLSVCTKIETDEGVRQITPEDITLLQIKNREMAEAALRVISMAYKEITQSCGNMDIVENELIFAGMVGMIDPAREEVIGAVAKCKSAGIRPIMITGDHQITALAIAKKIGIFRDGDLSITGKELENLDDQYFFDNVSKYSVYARVAPEQKVKIVKAWQMHNQIVAMTGDGVNDAPALKQADIGVSMGIVGTEVAKDASDMVLTDDNFATIVASVSEGRRIYDNILKTILFLLSTNIGEVLLLFITSIFNMGIPLLPIHILWINLVSETFPALALSSDPADKNIMKRKPRGSEGLMGDGMILRMTYQGIMIGVIPLTAYIIGLNQGGESLGQTMAFASLIAAKLVHVGNLHSNTKSRFSFNPLNNKMLILAIVSSAILAVAVIIVPVFRDAFKFVEMNSTQWWIIGALALIPAVVVEIVKLFKKK